MAANYRVSQLTSLIHKFVNVLKKPYRYNLGTTYTMQDLPSLC